MLSFPGCFCCRSAAAAWASPRRRPGLAGDLIAVDGDPLPDVSELERVKVVVQGGRVVRRD